MVVAYTTLAEELERTGLQVSLTEFESVVLDALRLIQTNVVVDHPERELTAAEQDALIRSGASIEELPSGVVSPLVEGAAQYTALLLSSYTVDDVARMLRVDPSRVRQRLAERSMYGVKLRGGWRIPKFQFDGDRMIPGVEQVIRAIPDAMDLVGLHNWFTLPDPDLDVEDRAVSPSDWLRRGGDPRIPAEMAADFEFGQ